MGARQYFILMCFLLGTCCEARIVVSVRRFRKILPTEKESSTEERVFQSLPHAMAHVVENHGYNVTSVSVQVKDPNGTWVPWDVSRIERRNDMDSHSHSSNERLQQHVEDELERRWPMVKGLFGITPTEDEDDLDDPAPFPESIPSTQNSPIVTEASPPPLHLRATNLPPAIQPTILEDDEFTAVLLVILVILCLILLIFVGAALKNWWNSRGRIPIVTKTRLGCDPVIEA